MKTRISKILGVMLSISMIASMFLFAAPVYAAPGDTQWYKESLPSGSTSVPYTSFFLWPGARVVDYAVADATTIYAAVAPVTANDLGIFKSTNAGQGWTQLTAFNTLVPLPGAPVAISVAPDNTSAIAVIDAGGKVYVSNDSGTTWSTLPALPAASLAAAVLDIAVGPARSGTLLGREYAIAVADPAAGAVAKGDLLIIGGTATWTSAGLTLTTGIWDFTSVVFSPNFLGDRCLIGVGTKVLASTTEMVIVNTATNAIVQKTLLVAAGGATLDFTTATVANSIVSSDIALPTNFDPTSTGGRRAYVGIASQPLVAAYPADNDVYRVDNDTTRALGAVSAKPVDSVSYSGTIDTGTLYMGQGDAANVKWTTSPTTTSPTWTTSTKNPISLAGYGAGPSAVNLGAAGAFAILAGTAITSVPTATITGDVGLDPAAGSNYAGLTVAEVTGTIYAVDATGPAGAAGNNPVLTLAAKNALTAAYIATAALVPTTTFVAADNQLGGQTLTPGVYAVPAAATANLIGTLTLDGQGNPNAVFIFQSSSTLVTAANSVVALSNLAQAGNVFWQVTSSATLGASSTFKGTIMALTAITMNGVGANVQGRLLARNAAVTLVAGANTIAVPAAAPNLPYTHIRVAADFTTSNRVFAATQGTVAGNNNEFAISNDGGVSFNGEAFINSIAKDVIGVGGGIQAIRLTPDGKTIYVATDDGTNLNLWKASIPVSGTGYSRILFVPAGTAGALALNNDYDTTPAVFFANMVGGGVIYVSSNAGATFNNRMAPAGVLLTAIAAQDANIVYIGDGAANIYKSTNAAWTWGTAVGGKAGVVNQIIVPRFDDVIVGGTGKVSYSVDGAATFTTIDTNLGGGLISVAADTLYAGNKTVFAGSVATGVIYRWIIGTSAAWENLANPVPLLTGISAMATKNGAVYGLNNTAAAFTTVRALNPLAAAGTTDWGTMATGNDVGPALYMQVSGTATENNVYIANGGKLLYSWKDWLAVTSPSLTSPADKATVGIDPVNGRGDPINIAFKPMGTSTGLVDTIDIEIQEKATGLTGTPTIGTQGVSGTAPSFLAPGPTIGTFFRANTEYIWAVRANNTANNAGIISKWTTPRTFTIQSGGLVQQPYVGPIIQSPQPGATNVDPKLVGFTWAPVTGATEYTVIVATDAALTKTVAGTPAKVTAPAFSAAGLDNSTTYFYSIQATKPTIGPQAIGSFTTAAKPAPTVAPTTPAPPTTPVIVFPPQATPAYVWAIIVIGGVLILAVIILIVRTRRVP